jgi:glycosidase
MEQPFTDHKHVIYQLLPRLFGNKTTLNKTYGSIEENGVGKLNDITDTALVELKKMGITHVWYTGVIAHATMTDYSAFGIKPDDPDVVKGRAGSPYAIRDYYDIDPDLAVDVNNRLAEFEALVDRTHKNNLKVIIDLVPNHVARTYHSAAKSVNVRDIGEDDDQTKFFDAKNDFYYIPGQRFSVPKGYNPGGNDFHSPLKDGKFDEYPAKATGNDQFSASPGINDWFETIKLNYGVDYSNGSTHFNPVPPLWGKIRDILLFWASKGVDGFRCDMVEMVPFEFWGWVIGQVKAAHPALIFIGEAYNENLYDNYLEVGQFDYLYDKVGLYDAIRGLTEGLPNASTWEINHIWNSDTKGIDAQMLRFMENHDEQRIASADFAGDPWRAVPGMIVSATLSVGPLMIYFGQEVGEPATGNPGFNTGNGRTTIFDYWGVPEHQKWVNGGAFDGGLLSDSQKKLRGFYSSLLNGVRDSEALRVGNFWELMLANEHEPWFNQQLYIFLRHTDKQRILVIANFNRSDWNMNIKFPADLLNYLNAHGERDFTDVLTGSKYHTDKIEDGLQLTIPASVGMLLEF